MATSGHPNRAATFGDSELDDQPRVSVELGARSIDIRLEDLPSLRCAIDGLFGLFGMDAVGASAN